MYRRESEGREKSVNIDGGERRKGWLRTTKDEWTGREGEGDNVSTPTRERRRTKRRETISVAGDESNDIRGER